MANEISRFNGHPVIILELSTVAAVKAIHSARRLELLHTFHSAGRFFDITWDKDPLFNWTDGGAGAST